MKAMSCAQIIPAKPTAVLSINMLTYLNNVKTVMVAVLHVMMEPP